MARRILVADDEPLTAEMVALMLAFKGFDVLCAYDGAEALRQARTWKPDVILLDVIMPEVEGVAVTRELRQDPALGALPIVLFSSVDEMEVDWREAGANYFLQKPIDLRALPDLVEKLLPPEDAIPLEPQALAS